LFNPKYSNVGVGDVSLTCYTTFDKSIEISLQNTTGVQATGTVEIFYLILD
jgi:phage-related protein